MDGDPQVKALSQGSTSAGSSDGGSSDGGSSDGGSSDGGGSGLGFFEQCSAAEECTSGICEQGICQGLQFGEECTSNDSCYSESCEDSACTAGNQNEICLVTTDCESDFVCGEPTLQHGVLTSGICTSPIGQSCTTDTDCRGAVCLETICSVYIPGELGFFCNNDAQCSTNNCVVNICLYKSNGDQCESSDECLSGDCTSETCAQV